MTASKAGLIDTPTLIGIGLLLAPLTVMWHEIGGHGGMCLATGGTLTQVGAYYVECTSHGDVARRLVSMAGVWADGVATLVASFLFQRAKAPLPRLLFWTVATSKAFCAAGYFLFSGVTDFGDYGPSQGLAPLSHPWIWRIGLVLVGGLAYWQIYRVASRALGQMIGANPAARRKIALTLYFTFGAVALIVGLFNPLGIVIVVMSAMASSFGGNAGLWSIAYDRSPAPTQPPFMLTRNLSLIGLGLLVSAAFAILLGPTLYLR